jgi:Trypsin-like peptidase domain
MIGVRRLPSPVLIALAALWAATATAHASTRALGGIRRTGTVGPGLARRIAAYWTPARMRSARPIGARGAPLPPGPAIATPSSRAVPNAVAYPYATAGRIFLRTRHGKAFCSGVAINSPSRRLVLTAGHCLMVREGSAIHPETTKYLEFVPAYAHGRAPFGRFVMEAGYVTTPWRKLESPNFDFGAVITYPNALGQDVADAVGGGADVALDLPRRQEYTIVGYPGYDQQSMQVCDGDFSGANPFSRGLPGPAQSLAGCYLAPGSSGGPWFVGEPPLLDGLTSETVQLHPFDHYLSSAYFGSRNLGPLIRAF